MIFPYWPSLLGGMLIGLSAAMLLLLNGRMVLFGHWPAVTITASMPTIVIAGLLVGFGTRMGSGCTSGHGVLGLAGFSRRSMAAVAAFLLAGILTVTSMRMAGL